MNIFDQIKLMYDSQLYEDVKLLGGMVGSLCEHNQEMLPMSARYQLLVYQGDAYYNDEQYKKAESMYKQSLQMKKSFVKNKAGKTPTYEVSPGEIDVKYKLHECYCKLKQYKDAIGVLEGIPSRQRNAKINLALARLHQRAGANDRSAATAYKEVLRECPLSLEAAHGLLTLGMKGAEVESLIKQALPQATNIDWVFHWIRAQANCINKDYTTASQTLKMLDNKPWLRGNIDVLLGLGEAQFLNGDYQLATATLARVHALDPMNVKKMDTLAYLHFKNKALKELEIHGSQLILVTESSPEPWVALGYFCMATRKTTRAVYFAQKALNINSASLEALLLKGSALLELNKTQDAIIHLREAVRLAPYRFEVHKALVVCYLKSHRLREAINCAAQACKQISSARSLTLYASVIAKEPTHLDKAKGYLEKAMKIDPNYLPAVYSMADILAQKHLHERGIQLLHYVMEKHNNAKLHQLMGTFLQLSGNTVEALKHFDDVLYLDPNNRKAREARNRIQKAADVTVDTNYADVEEDMDGSDNEPELEGSDIESAWSDIDLSY